MKLPSTISPELLEKILRYAPNQRRKIETDIVKESNFGWGEKASSNKEFYLLLHNLLQDSASRKKFNSIARNHSSKRRALDLDRSIHYFYQRKYPGIKANLASQHHNEITPKEVVHGFAEFDDFECTANILWTYVESDSLDNDEVEKLFEIHPDLKGVIEDANEDEGNNATHTKWDTALMELSNVFDSLQQASIASRVMLTTHLQLISNKLLKIAESEESDIWVEIDALIDNHRNNFDKFEELKQFEEELAKDRPNRVFHSNWREELIHFDKAITNYVKEENSAQEIIEQLNTVKPEERQILIDKIAKSDEHRKNSLRQIENAVSKLFEVDKATDSEPIEQTGVESEIDTVSDQDSPVDIAVVESEEQKESESVVTETNDESNETEENIKLLSSNDEKEIIAKLDEIKQKDISDDIPEIQESKAKMLLDRLLSQGDFSLAYWVADVSDVCDVNILGTLAEGTQIQPGYSYSERLAGFLSELVTTKTWSDEEKLLLVAAIIQPLLLLRTYPESLYQVASTVPFTVLTEFVDNFRKTYLPQGITIGPSTVQIDSAKTVIEDQLHELSEKSRKFLLLVPHIKFRYPPGERALKHIYRSDSDWYKLHKIIEQEKTGCLHELKDIRDRLDVQAAVNSVPDAVMRSKQRITGYAKSKITKCLRDSLELATNWINLVELSNQQQPERNEILEEELKQLTIDELEKILKTLNENQTKSAAAKATECRLRGLLSILYGEKVEATGIDAACINLSGIRLDDSMIPINVTEEEFLDAIEEFLDKESVDPQTVFEECLDNDEFVRAMRLIEINNLTGEATRKLEQKQDERHNELKIDLENLQSKVEEAYLLGQLWDADTDINFRTDLLSQVSEGLRLLDAQEFENGENIRLTADIVSQIEIRLKDISRNRITYLETTKASVVKRFPETQQGESDRTYFESTFTQCFEEEDHVTAFDLLERAQHALEHNEPIARTASTELSVHFKQFQDFIEQHLENFPPNSIAKFISAIQNRKTIFGIHFGDIDSARLKDSELILEKWKDLQESSNIEEICRFVGFPVIPKHTQFVQQNQNGLIHFQAELSTTGPTSPLPGFGSGLNSRIDIIVNLRSLEPNQISEFIQQAKIGNRKAVLVLLARRVRSNYRLKWLKECVHSQVMMLPLDTGLLMYLCGQRNRLSALLEIGLPYTWAQPYITKGENVAREMFVGRNDEVLDLIDSSGSCIVFGGRQLGKSALLTHVKREHHNAQAGGGTFIAYLDVNDLGEAQLHDEMSQAFWKRVYEQLVMLNAFGDGTQLAKQRKTTKWTEIVPNFIESTLGGDDNMRIILLLDETDKLLDLDSEMDFTLIRGLRALMANTERRFKVVLAGLQSVQRYNNWKNHPFAQLGKEIVINPLQSKAAEDLITRPFRALGFQFESAALVRRIVSISNYHPGLVQIFCYRLLENLYKNYSEWKSPTRFVTEDDVLSIERDASFKEDVRNRFDWTLDLDDRYKVITYGLVLSPRPTDARTIKEFKELGVTWWRQVFSNMDAQAVRAVLDEMVGLGVLSLQHDENESVARRYRLRSPNLLRLLGPKETIEEELLRIMSSDRLSRPNPRNFRNLVAECDTFGPLTKEQEGNISNTSDNFSLTIIVGTVAMGLQEVPNQIRSVLGSNVGYEGTKWQEFNLPTTGGLNTTKNLLDRLRQKLKPRKRSHLYSIINFEELMLDDELGNSIETLALGLRNICRTRSKGRLIILLNPDSAWNWILSERRPIIEENTEIAVMELRRWSDGSIRNALDQINLSSNSKSSATEIFHATAGIHSIVADTLRDARTRKGNSASPAIKIANAKRNSLLESNNSDMLSDLGISNDNSDLNRAVIELFRCSDTRNGESLISEDSFEFCLEALTEDAEARNVIVQNKLKVINWLTTLDLIRPANKEGTDFHPCEITLKLIQTL